MARLCSSTRPSLNGAFWRPPKPRGRTLKWFVVDMIPVTLMDITGLQAAVDVIETLRVVASSLSPPGAKWNGGNGPKAES